MTAGQTIAKLEALLARVRSRAGEPRPFPRAAAAAISAPPADLARSASDEPLDLDEESDQPTLPPPPIVQAAPAAPAPASARPRVPAPSPAPALELSVEIDVSVEEPAVALAEEAVPVHPPVSEASSSQERLVAVEPLEPLAQEAQHALPAEVGEPAIEVSRVSPQPAAQAAAPPPAAEEEEEPPVSSRRPLAPAPEERLAEMAFGTEEPRPPLHTPPPESGQLPAAPALEFADEDTGVRAAAPIAPETTRVELGGGGQVAAVHGSVQAFHPTSFAELLDASLSL